MTFGWLKDFFGFDQPERTVLWQDRCPVCGRVLVTFYDDGAFKLADRAGTTMAARVPDGELPPEFRVKAHPLRGYGLCGLCHPEVMEPEED